MAGGEKSTKNQSKISQLNWNIFSYPPWQLGAMPKAAGGTEGLVAGGAERAGGMRPSLLAAAGLQFGLAVM